MSESFDIYTLLFLVLAVVIFLRLRSVLGRRTGNERPPYDPYSARDAARPGQPKPSDTVLTFPRRGEPPRTTPAEPESSAEDAAARVSQYAPDGSPLRKGLTDIARDDASFAPDQFLKGAKTAYEMIVSAFAQGDRRTLKSLLGRDVYDGFISAINERESRGETVESNFVGIDKADIVEAEVKNRAAQLTVKFVSSLVTATRDRDGELIEGDPKKVREVTDIWTFARDTNSRDPNWKLVATEAAN